jgi:hypothetical protein
MAGRGNITSFFKPVSKSPQSSRPKAELRTEASRTPPPPSPSPSSAHFPSSPPIPTSTLRDRNAVIRGSDDEDDDDFGSDDDFPELFSNLPRNPPPVQAAGRGPNIHATPKAKRRVLEFHSSPLTINTKHHKFDIRALLQHAEADDAVEEGEQRTAALIAQGSPTARDRGVGNEESAGLRETMLDVLSDPEGSQDEGNRGRLMQAVKRTEATAGRKEWYFFDRQNQPNSTAIQVRHPFPKTEATGVWAFLGPEKHRSEIFEDGLPYNVQCRMQNLPDKIFLWVLDEAPYAKSRKLQDEYMRLLGVCSDQIRRLLLDDKIVGLFLDLGASERALATRSQPSGDSENGAPYPEDCRIRLQSVLRILAGTAHALTTQALTRTMSILLRLGIDDLVREDEAVATEYQDALLQVVLAVPWRIWNNFVRNPLLPAPFASKSLT